MSEGERVGREGGREGEGKREREREREVKGVIMTHCICLYHVFSVNVPPRTSSKRITARGLFPNAKVVRGRDWMWQNQDGK